MLKLCNKIYYRAWTTCMNCFNFRTCMTSFGARWLLTLPLKLDFSTAANELFVWVAQIEWHLHLSSLNMYFSNNSDESKANYMHHVEQKKHIKNTELCLKIGWPPTYSYRAGIQFASASQDKIKFHSGGKFTSDFR